MSRTRHQHTHSVTTGMNPGGPIPAGYSYLERSHSLITPSRRTVPKSMSANRLDTDLPADPVVGQLHHSGSLSNLNGDTAVVSPALVKSLSNSSLGGDYGVQKKEKRSIAQLVAHLPPNPEFWMPSQVALYLTHVLALTPKPVVHDVTGYVRNARMGGRQFLRLRESDLIDEGLNLKWRKLMIEAVKKLRKDCVRNRIWPLEYMTQWDNDASRMVSTKSDQPSHAKGTLKRLRDKRAVREMITNFENISEGSLGADGDELTRPGRLLKRDSISSLNSFTSSNSSPRLPLAPVYGDGYVRDQAASFSSDRVDGKDEGRDTFSHEQLEEWFGDLSMGEAEALADELEAQDYTKHHGRISTSSSHSSYLSTSESGNDSAPQTPSIGVKSGFDLTPIDAEIVRSIVEMSSTDIFFVEDGKDDDSADVSTAAQSALAYIKPLHKDVLIDEEDDNLKLINGAASRPLKENSRLNPYRRSTYDEEEASALGLHGGIDTYKFDTARRKPFDMDIEAVEFGPAKNSIPRRKTDTSPDTADFRELFSPAVQVTKSDGLEGRAAVETVPSHIVDVANSTRMPETYGRTAFAAALHAQQVQTSVEADSSVKNAENESEWGTTFSRKASRRGTAARSELKRFARSIDGGDTRYNTATSRLSLLFKPAEAASESQVPGDSHDALGEGKVIIPLSTMELDADGNKSLRKTSMVLVDRRKFEALAKRMGALEEHLSTLEAASSTGTDRSSSTDSLSNRSPLSSIFDGHSQAREQHHGEGDNPDEMGEAEGSESREWNMAMRFGMIPSYVSDLINRSSPTSKNVALGLAAGAGFVLLSEVFGRGRR